jgi:hypothetical protein
MPGPIKFQIDDLVIDATPEQSYTGDVETTENPVEEGANVVDHARVKPETWTGTCVVSNTPIDQADRTFRGVPALLPAGGTAPGTGGEEFNKGGYARTVYQRLKKMKDDRLLHALVTPLRSYSNMIITALSVPTKAQYGDAIQFTIAFREIRVVKSNTAQFLRTTRPTNTLKPTDKDNQAKKQGETESTDNESIGKKFLDDIHVLKKGSATGVVKLVH